MSLSKINQHPNDVRIKFQEYGHKYWIDGSGKDIVSTTSLIKTFFPEFDSDRVIKGILASPKYQDPTYKYYGMTYQEISASWKANSTHSRNEGTKLHLDIENYYNGITSNQQNSSVEYEYFKKFVENTTTTLNIYRTEWVIFIEALKVTGSIDAVFQRKDAVDSNRLIIADWKRSKNVSQESFNNNSGFFPLNHLIDCNFNHYALQLNLYRIALEKCYDKIIEEMFLVVLHPENSCYIKIDIPRLDKEIDYIFWSRKQQLEKIGHSVSFDISHIPMVEVALEEHEYKPLLKRKREDEVQQSTACSKSLISTVITRTLSTLDI